MTGMEKARASASKTVRDVRKIIGFKTFLTMSSRQALTSLAYALLKLGAIVYLFPIFWENIQNPEYHRRYRR